MVSYKNCRYSVQIVFPVSWLMWNVSNSSLSSNLLHHTFRKLRSWHLVHGTTSWQIDGETVADFIFLGSKITADNACSLGIKDTPCKESYDQPRQHIKKQRHYFVNKGLSSQGYGFSSSRVWMWELDYKESWAMKHWCLWTVVLEKTLESPLDYKEIQPVHPKGDQSWVFIGRTDVEAETPILWSPDVKSWFTGKDTDAGKDWGWEEKGTMEDEMVGWHHQLNEYEFG